MVSQRIKRRYWNYWEYKDERLEVPPEHVETAFNQKKNTKKWCKGKVGREHEPVIEVDQKRFYNQRDKDKASCGWMTQYGWGQVGRYVRGRWWNCRHHKVCSKCGKVLQYRLDLDDCPLYQ